MRWIGLQLLRKHGVKNDTYYNALKYKLKKEFIMQTLKFDEFIRSLKQNKDTKHSLLLGAGASVESGVPSATDCIWAVSYTHLDVYKRQMLTICRFLNHRLFLTLGSGFGLSDIVV